MLSDSGLGLYFADHPAELLTPSHVNDILHVLITGGSVSFYLKETLFNAVKYDYLIFPNPAIVKHLCTSADFTAQVMSFTGDFNARVFIRSNYGAIGHCALLQNPVMRLDGRDFEHCRHDLAYLKERALQNDHRFHAELVGNLFVAHVLDLFDIHMRQHAELNVSASGAALLNRFVELLYAGHAATHREVRYFADRLYVSPHYLSEVCRKASGESASDWIERFAVSAVTALLNDKTLTLTQIAERLNFSSLSYLTRFVKKHLGLTPSAYRDSLQERLKAGTA